VLVAIQIICVVRLHLRVNNGYDVSKVPLSLLFRDEQYKTLNDEGINP
jgi:hypothetical protein